MNMQTHASQPGRNKARNKIQKEERKKSPRSFAHHFPFVKPERGKPWKEKEKGKESSKEAAEAAESPV